MRLFASKQINRPFVCKNLTFLFKSLVNMSIFVFPNIIKLCFRKPPHYENFISCAITHVRCIATMDPLRIYPITCVELSESAMFSPLFAATIGNSLSCCKMLTLGYNFSTLETRQKQGRGLLSFLFFFFPKPQLMLLVVTNLVEVAMPLCDITGEQNLKGLFCLNHKCVIRSW